MKKLIIILVLAITASSSYSIAAPVIGHSVVVLSMKREIFYFKIDKSLIGGVVEVFDTKGNLMSSEVMTKRKMIIDFFDLPFGKYVIKVRKDAEVNEFNYVK